jgi:hypothetical protein
MWLLYNVRSLALCAVAVIQSIAVSANMREGPSLPVVLAYYTTAGTILGALTGLLVPIMHTLLGAVGVCVLWGFTLYSGALLIIDGRARTPRVTR